jgi:hypothetical protein
LRGIRLGSHQAFGSHHLGAACVRAMPFAKPLKASSTSSIKCSNRLSMRAAVVWISPAFHPQVSG